MSEKGMNLRRCILVVMLALYACEVVAAGQSYECLIEPYRRIELRSPVQALIERVLIDRGSFVHQGQLLVQLDSRIEQAALASARYRSVMEGETLSAQARVSHAREKFHRRDELRSRNFISAQDRDDSLTEASLAEADLLQSKDNNRLAALEAKRLEETIAQRQLRAPFTGIVVDRLQHPGELAFTGEGAKPILKLAQTDPLRVEVIMPLAAYGTVKPGILGEVEPEAPLKGKWSARVKIVDRVVDSASGTFGVRLELPNPKGEIPSGVKCRVQFD